MDRMKRPRSADERLPAAYARERTPELRDAAVESFLYIAEIIARRFSGRGVEYDDLVQVAALALVKGLERFDPEKGVRFASFITPTMVGEVKNYFRDRARTVRLPRRGQELARAIARERGRLEQTLGRSPRVDELAEALGVSEDEVLEGLELGAAMTPVSLDAQLASDEDGETALKHLLGGVDPAFGEFERSDMLRRAMEGLDERQRAVIQGRFFEGMSQRDLADRMNISQMTVSRVERQALAILRERLTGQE